MPEIPPFQPRPSAKKYHIPQTIQSDFERYLYTDVPNVNYWYDGYSNWYTKEDEQTAYRFRGSQFSINWKSKYSGSDNTQNLRAKIGTPLKKGDLLVREDGRIYVVYWNIEPEINNIRTQVQECNAMSKFVREQAAQVGDDFKLESAESDIVIAEQIPFSISFIQNRFEYDIANNVPGIVPNDTAVVSVQFNEQTRNLQIGDMFEYWGSVRRIVSIVQYEIDIHKTHGLLTFYAEKVAGRSSL